MVSLLRKASQGRPRASYFIGARYMRVDVAFVAGKVPDPQSRVCVVIDALRATSTLVTMFARGLESALVVGSLVEARRQAKVRPGWLLCGEKRSLPPAGFDYGNSPVEFSTLELSGKSAVFTTTNGTRALLQASGCSAVFAGALLNLTAVTRAAGQEANRSGKSLLIQCAGDDGGRTFNLEDAFCGGAMVDLLATRPGPVGLTDAARAARRLYRSYRGSTLVAFRQAAHGAGLRRVGLGEDVTFCAQQDRYRVVPRLQREADGLLLRLA
jgi:2-phosphosulfolactate phosphatase